MKYGKHTDLVEAFLAHLKSGNVDWAAAFAARDTAFDARVAARFAARVAARFAAFDAAFDALDARDAARDAAWGAARDAGYAAYEIIGHEILAEQNKPLVFLRIFGIESIEKLKEMVK